MSQQRCEQGHYYDTSVHRRCPSCGVSGLDLAPTIPHDEDEGERSWHGDVSPPSGDPSRYDASAGAPSDVLPRETHPWGGALRDEGVTVAFWSRPRGDGHAAPDGPPTDPVVGWLVAIEGPEGTKGRDYRIFSEGNPIGRENHHRIVIKDESVARDVHAILTYDPRSTDHAYYLTPGGRHMVYRVRQVPKEGGGEPDVSREAIVQATRLSPFDVLEIGKTRLIFVPLCGTQFRWKGLE